MVIDISTTQNSISHDDWKRFENTYECEVALIAEDHGFSALSTQLVGVASEGETEEEAIENIRQALTGALEVYLKRGSIPWDSVDFKELEVEPLKTKRILVHVTA